MQSYKILKPRFYCVQPVITLVCYCFYLNPLVQASWCEGYSFIISCALSLLCEDNFCLQDIHRELN
uniref:Uncharacterized protein n=1 Tax=Anguilla anguilla TaxID=7936 RepID=A0A0E9W733_ANGAN